VPERITLDAAEVASGRTAFEITPWIDDEGPDWGDGAISAYMSQGMRGEIPVDFTVPNRTVQIPLILRAQGGTSFATVRSLVQAKASLFQREGGWLKRVTSAGGTVYADVVNATLKLGGGWLQSAKDADLDATLSLECLPDFYEAERTLTDHVETSATELVFTETDVDGDYPARVRVVVDDDQGQAQLGLIWSFRNRHYQSASTAATRFEAEALNPLDTASRAALTGASGGTVVTHGTLSTNWTPVLDMRAGGTAYPTHTGTNRLWVRYRTTSGTAVQLRAVWDVGDMVFPVENTPIRCNGGTSFFMHDLGEVRLDPSPTGPHRWNAIIQGKGDAGGENVSLDKVFVVNADEGYGVLRTPSSLVDGLVPFSARDDFNSHAGGANLTTKTAPVGGAWTGGGDTDDFQTSAPGAPLTNLVLRSVLSDTAPRVDWLPTSLTSIIVQTDVVPGTLGRDGGTTSQEGADMVGIAAVVDASNYLSLSIKARNSERALEVTRTIAATRTIVDTMSLEGQIVYNGYYRLRLKIDTAGRWWAYFVQSGSAGQVSNLNAVPVLVSAGQDNALATGGTLATRKPGLIDYVSQNASSSLPVRQYENFLAYAPAPDAAINPSQSLEMRWDGMFREDAGGTAFGPVSEVIGDLPRLPPTVEGRTTEVFIKASRGDLAQLPDTGIDDISARISYRPCWLTVPGT
jgi:hypothetical protein